MGHPDPDPATAPNLEGGATPPLERAATPETLILEIVVTPTVIRVLAELRRTGLYGPPGATEADVAAELLRSGVREAIVNLEIRPRHRAAPTSPLPPPPTAIPGPGITRG